MSCYINVVGCTKNDDHNGIDKGDCPYCGIDRLTAQLAERDAEIKRLADIVEDAEQAYFRMVDKYNARLALQAENAALREEVGRLKESEEVLTDCLNGSSKAKYTAELYDKGVADARKQAARECIDTIVKYGMAWSGHEYIPQIKAKFGLEG